jgi:hypothetical protein
VNQLAFIELLEEAARYDEAFAVYFDACDSFEVAEEEPAGDCAEESGDGAGTWAVEEPLEGDHGQKPAGERLLDLALAAGFMLRTKADGWKLFCERMNVPPFLLWQGLPGWQRLQSALARTEKAAFVPEGFLRWLNRVSRFLPGGAASGGAATTLAD